MLSIWQCHIVMATISKFRLFPKHFQMQRSAWSSRNEFVPIIKHNPQTQPFWLYRRVGIVWQLKRLSQQKGKRMRHVCKCYKLISTSKHTLKKRYWKSLLGRRSLRRQIRTKNKSQYPWNTCEIKQNFYLRVVVQNKLVFSQKMCFEQIPLFKHNTICIVSLHSPPPQNRHTAATALTILDVII